MKRMIYHGGRAIAFWVALCAGCIQSFAQDTKPPTVIQPSPTAASLGKYGDIPVGYHTGVTNISIPLYDVKEGPIMVPISLNYHASGIRVSEVASWVGLGWALNCGGVITRTVQHVPDEGPLKYVTPSNYFINPGPEGQYFSSGYYKDGYILPSGIVYDQSGSVNVYRHDIYRDAAQGNVDCEPDIFFYNFGNYSGKFLFKVTKSGDTLQREAVFIPKADVKVAVTFTTVNVPDHRPNSTTPRTTFESFVITTPDGFMYSFGGAGATEFSGSESYNSSSYAFSDNVMLSPTSWFLTRIESPDGRFITFQYASDNHSFFDLGTERCWGGDAYLDRTNQTVSRTVISGVQLRKILTSTEQVVFFADTLREDLAGYEAPSGAEQSNTSSKKLDRISIQKLSGVEIRNFEFGHNYFESIRHSNDPPGMPLFMERGDGNFTSDKKRLKLLSVTERSGDGTLSKPPYIFTYKETTAGNVPASLPRRISYEQDHWGYYNGAWENNTLIDFDHNSNNMVDRRANRNTNTTFSQLGTLESVRYPTGAVSKFTYESNQANAWVSIGSDSISTVFAGTYLVGASNVEVIGPIELGPSSYSQFSPCRNLHLGCDLVYAHVSINVGNSRPGSGTYDLNYYAPNVYNSVIVGVYKENGDFVSNGRFEVSLLKGAGTAACAGNCTSSVSSHHKTVSFDMELSMPPGKYYVKAFKILSGPETNQLVITSSVSLRYPRNRDVGFINTGHYEIANVGGLRIKNILTVDGAETVQNRSFSYPTHGGILYSQPTYFFAPRRVSSIYYPPTASDVIDQLWSSSSILPMQTTQGSHIGYSFVKEYQSGNGYSMYTYDTLIHSYSIASGNPYFQGSYSGVTNVDRYFDYPPFPVPNFIERGNLLKEEKFNEADKLVYQKDNEYEIGNSTVAWHATKTEFLTMHGYSEVATFANHTHYPIFAGTSRLLSETETTYDANGLHPIQTRKEYKYESTKHLQPTEVKRHLSSGTELTSMIYPPDYGLMSGSAGGIKNLQEGNIINIPIEQYKVRDSGVVEGTITTFKPDRPVRDEVKSLKISQPIPLTEFVKSNSVEGQFTPFNLYESRLFFHNYDSQGNLKEVSKRNDVHTSYIWGYNNTLPIAEVKNATSSSIFHTSFEENTTNVSNDFVTGSKSYNGTYRVVVPSAGIFNLTYWKKISGSSWSLIKTTISQDTDIGGTGILIDEVRVFPIGAMMTTYTYDPNLGMTTSTDQSNHITYFEYDKMGRLEVIKDHDKNVQKSYSYKYKQ